MIAPVVTISVYKIDFFVISLKRYLSCMSVHCIIGAMQKR
jgi:hypothetical protein